MSTFDKYNHKAVTKRMNELGCSRTPTDVALYSLYKSANDTVCDLDMDLTKNDRTLLDLGNNQSELFKLAKRATSSAKLDDAKLSNVGYSIVVENNLIKITRNVSIINGSDFILIEAIDKLASSRCTINDNAKEIVLAGEYIKVAQFTDMLTKVLWNDDPYLVMANIMIMESITPLTRYKYFELIKELVCVNKINGYINHDDGVIRMVRCEGRTEVEITADRKLAEELCFLFHVSNTICGTADDVLSFTIVTKVGKELFEINAKSTFMQFFVESQTPVYGRYSIQRREYNQVGDSCTMEFEHELRAMLSAGVCLKYRFNNMVDRMGVTEDHMGVSFIFLESVGDVLKMYVPNRYITATTRILDEFMLATTVFGNLTGISGYSGMDTDLLKKCTG